MRRLTQKMLLVAFLVSGGTAMAQTAPAKETKSTRDTIRTASPPPVIRRDTVRNNIPARRDTVVRDTAKKETRSTRDTIKTTAPPVKRDTVRRDTSRVIPPRRPRIVPQ